MKKIELNENMRTDFLTYSLNRKSKLNLNNRPMNYLTESILDKTFSFMLQHKLTVEENAKSYYFQNGKANILCYGYSGCSINERDDTDGMMFNLFHEIFCKAEWIARSVIGGYSDVVKSTIGTINYNKICI